MNSRTRRFAVLAAAIAVLALAALFAFTLARHRWPEYGIEYETLQMARENLALAPVKGRVVALESPEVDEEIAALANRASGHAVSPRPDRVAELGGTQERLHEGILLAIETVMRRAADDPESYLEWARSRGCIGEVFITPSHLVKPDGEPLYDAYDSAWRFTFNEPMPASTTPARFVVAMLRATQERYDGRAWIRELLLDDRAIFVEASVADDRGNGFEYTLINQGGGPGADFWMGSIGMRCERTLVCGRLLQQVIDDRGEALVMNVHLAGLSPKGEPIPITCTMYFDPAAKAWRMHAMDLANVKEPVPYLAF